MKIAAPDKFVEHSSGAVFWIHISTLIISGAPMKATLLRLLLGICLLGTVNLVAQPSINGQQVVAEVGGQKLTSGDLEQQEGGKLLQARYQYYLSQRKALDDLIDGQLLANEARKKHLTVDQLLEQEVYKSIKDPTEDQLQVYCEGLETQQPYEVIRGQVLEHIRELRRSKARASYVEVLRKQADISLLLMPPEAHVDLANSYIRGSRDAEIVLVEFADYECPYCQQVMPGLQLLRKEYGDKVAIAYKDFPLPMHQRAQKAAEAARCAGSQGKFWEYHDALFYGRLLDVADLKKHARALKLDGDRFDQCLDHGEMASLVKKDLEEGKSLGLTGTPSFFVNGHFFSGAVDYATLKQMVDQQLAFNQRSKSHAMLSKR
jgi:protein-disulfide isomerase